jgi:hypothetical protein
MEPLEERVVLSTLDFLVNTTLPASASPTATSGGIVDAVNAANADTTDSAVSITFDPSVFVGMTRTIQLTSGLVLNPTNTSLSVTIDATSAGGVTLIGGYFFSSSFSVITLSGGTANLTDLTITNGFAADSGVDNGGGISNSATLTLDNSSVTNNYSQGHGNASGGGGGGIYNAGTLTVLNSTINHNTASGSNDGAIGGGILNDGTLTLTNSTIVNNASANWGGGINSDAGSHATLLNDTITGNYIISFGNGAGLENNSGNDISLTNTILADNNGQGDLYAETGSTNSGSFDIIGDSSSLSNLTSSLASQSANLTLAPLNYYGGPTQTVALLSTPFVGTFTGAPTLDQRGFSRGDSVDIGAYQSQTLAVNSLVTTANDPGVPGLMSLRGAVDLADLQTTDVAITFAASYSIQMTVPQIFDVSNPNTGEVITIDASSVGGVAVIGGGPVADCGVLGVDSGTVSITDLNISHGNANNQESGGGIYNYATLTLTNCTISGNSASSQGGGVYNGGTITITGCTISGNSLTGRGDGAGFENEVTATISDSTFSDNTASTGGSYGGGIGNYGPLTINGSTITSNTVNGFGGGLYNDGSGSVTTITGGTISGNSVTGSGSGGGIYNEAPITITNVDISGNSSSNGGGGVYNTDSLTINGGTISENSAVMSGGGIFSNHSLALAGTTISNNTAGTNGGGADDGDTNATYANCTFANNTATGNGGGLYNDSGILTIVGSNFSGNSASNGGGLANLGSTLTVNNSTFSGNSASSSGGGADLDGGTLNNDTFGGNLAATGGGIANTATALSLTNTIVAGSTGGDFAGSILAASRNNLIDDPATSSGLVDGVNGNIINHPASLSTLGSYGGPTETFTLLSGSPALDAGLPVTLTTPGDPIDAVSTNIPATSPYNVGVGIYIQVDGEIMLVVDIPNGSSLDVLRGQMGTTAATHAAGADLNIATDQRGVLRSSTTPSIGALEVVPATILSVSPGQGLGAGGTTVTLVGTHFLEGATITVGGVAATNVVVVDATTITFTTPAGLAGPANIVLTNGDGFQVTKTGGFNYQNPVIVVGPGSLFLPTVGDTFREQLTASGGSGSGYSFTATGVPAGLTLSVGGLLSGTPTSALPFTMVVTVTDGDNATGDRSYAITADPAITLGPTTLPTLTVGDSYNQQLTASGGSGSGYSFASNTLPPGLTLSNSGLVSGTPTDATGVAVSVSVTVTDGEGGTGSASYLLQVKGSSQAGSVVSSAPQTYYGQDVVLTATFSATGVGNFPMTGTVSFYDGDTSLGTVPLIGSNSVSPQFSAFSSPFVAPTVSGQASLPTTALAVGSHVIRAVYSGDANYSPATSETPVSVQVIHTVTSTTLASSTTAAGTVLTANVVVTSPGDPTVAGSISFYDGTTLLGSSTIIDGVATLNLGTLSAGQHQFSAVFSGGGNSSSSGSSGTVTVNPTVTGTVYLDLNANGVLDSGEPGLAGRVVFLDVNHDGTLDAGDPTATTDANGHFTLSDTATGSVVVIEATAQDSSDRWVVDQATTNADGTVSIGVVPISPVAPVPVVPNPFSTSPSPDANTAYVQSLYKAVLGRTGADSEVATWLAKLTGGMSMQEVAAGFVNSPEHRQDQVNAYYEEFLHRAPDPTSVSWVNELLSGVSEETVVEGILDSPEYQAAHVDSTVFINDLYTDVLGRQGESTSVAGWLAAAASGTSREAIVAGFVQSTEAIDQVVDSFYTAYLHRQPEPVTSDTWVTMLEQPDGSATDVAFGLLSSPEFVRDATTPQI